MKITNPFRSELGGVSNWINEALDSITARINAVFGVEHNDDGTHGALTAESLTLETSTIADDWTGNVGASLVPSVAGVDLGATVPVTGTLGADLPFRNIRMYGTFTYTEGFNATGATGLGGNRYTLTFDSAASEWKWTFGTSSVTGYPLVLRLHGGINTHTLTIGAGAVGLTSSNAIAAASLSATGSVSGSYLEVTDGISAPGAGTGARIYVDTLDGDLKVVFADGTVKTIVTDT